MAFPTVVARTETALTTAGTTFTINFTQTTGDLVVIFVACSGQGTITLGDGFTNWTNHNSRFHLIYKVLAGTEGGNVAVTTVSSKGAANAYNITGFDPTVPAYKQDTEAGTLDSDYLDPGVGAKDFLWIVSAMEGAVQEELDDDTWVTTTPANYTNLLQKTSGTGGAASSNVVLATAERQLNASSEDPGAFVFAQVPVAAQSRLIAVNPVDRVPRFTPYPQLLAH